MGEHFVPESENEEEGPVFGPDMEEQEGRAQSLESLDERESAFERQGPVGSILPPATRHSCTMYPSENNFAHCGDDNLHILPLCLHEKSSIVKRHFAVLKEIVERR